MIFCYWLLFCNATAVLCLALEVLCLAGAARSPACGYTTVFTNIEIAWDEVSIESGMCVWQISTPDNI